MARIRSLFKIKIINWKKHQESLKKNHSHFLFSKRFFDDPKVSQLTQNECLLFINLLCIAADFMSDSFEIHSKMFPDLLRISDKSLLNSLETLQLFQLLTYEKQPLNRIEKNRIEDNIKEKNISTEPKKSVAVVQEKNTSEVLISENLKISISNDLIKSWSDTYPKEFLEQEFKNARNWVLSNPHKAPKSAWGKFFNGWFSRGWERYRTTLKSNQTSITVDDLNSILGVSNEQ